jgi:outer membrane protein, heavy metal efflux system
MILKTLILLFFALPLRALGQVDSVVIPESPVMHLEMAIEEAMTNNPEIRAATSEMTFMDAKASQAGVLPDPELKFMQDAMPGFRWNEAMFSRLMLEQMIPFPSKLSTEREAARIFAEHAHHEHLEKIDEVLAKVKSAYYELWFYQQTIVLGNESARLMDQFLKIAQTRYGTGSATQQEVLKAQVELSMIRNDLLDLRQKELSAKAMLGALLNRVPTDTIGYAMIPEEVHFSMSLDSLLDTGLRRRPMLVHDSLEIDAGKVMLSLAKEQYFPDFRIGLEHLYSPMDGMTSWSISAGITLPFAPWSLGRTGAKKEEATASIDKSRALYQADRQMVAGNIRDLYYKADAAKKQLDTYRRGILPQARQSLNASLTAYQNGTTDFLMLMDAYRTQVNLTKEYFMTRMKFELAVTGIEREIGSIWFTLNGMKGLNHE